MSEHDALTFPSCSRFPTWLIYSSKSMCQAPLLDLPVQSEDTDMNGPGSAFKEPSYKLDELQFFRGQGLAQELTCNDAVLRVG